LQRIWRETTDQFVTVVNELRKWVQHYLQKKFAQQLHSCGYLVLILR
jgi:hypothetical protein